MLYERQEVQCVGCNTRASNHQVTYLCISAYMVQQKGIRRKGMANYYTTWYSVVRGLSGSTSPRTDLLRYAMTTLYQSIDTKIIPNHFCQCSLCFLFGTGFYTITCFLACLVLGDKERWARDKLSHANAQGALAGYGVNWFRVAVRCYSWFGRQRFWEYVCVTRDNSRYKHRACRNTRNMTHKKNVCQQAVDRLLVSNKYLNLLL
jgi:hypothetical protein